MHLWPSMSIRDSFKEGYLKKLDWNLNRMKSQQNQSNNSSSNNQQKLLGESDDDSSKGCGGIALFCREFLMIVSCCYCCFCCGRCMPYDAFSFFFGWLAN